MPIKFLGPVGKRTMAEVMHAAATRLVCQRFERGVRSHGTEGSEVVMAAYFSTRVPLSNETSAIEQRWPKHNLQSTLEGGGWTMRRVYCEGCLACASCVSPPALLSAIAGNQPAVALGLF